MSVTELELTHEEWIAKHKLVLTEAQALQILASAELAGVEPHVFMGYPGEPVLIAFADPGEGG